MKTDLNKKIKDLLDKGTKISESEVRSLMIIIRKRLESMTDAEKQNYLILTLFCNWCAHIKIDQSNTGLRIIAKVNDALVQVKDLQDAVETQSKLSESMGYVSLRRELISFIKNIGLDSISLEPIDMSKPNITPRMWGELLTYLLEIIRDVDLTFPLISKLDATKQKIYDQIVKNPITPGGGVISMKITKVDYSKMGRKDMESFFHYV